MRDRLFPSFAFLPPVHSFAADPRASTGSVVLADTDAGADSSLTDDSPAPEHASASAPTMHVVLADPPSAGFGKLQHGPNLGLLHLSSYLKREMPSVRIHYLPERYTVHQQAATIRKFGAAIYAISFTSFAALRAYETIRCLKAQFPRLKVVCGGPHPSAAPREVAAQEGVDVCVIGEGEVTFAEVTQAGACPEALSVIAGIAYQHHGEIHVNPPRPFVRDIDDLPFPDRAVVVDSDFTGLSLSRNTPNAEMIVSRGCPFRCIFCSNPVFRPEEIRRKADGSGEIATTLTNAAVGRSLRTRSPALIAREAEQLYRRGYREIYLHSDELNSDLAWALEVCDALAELGHRDLCFQTNLRADKVTPEFARSLRKMNTWLVRIGIESSSPRVMRAQRKMVSLAEVEQACGTLAAHGLKVFGYFMMFQFWEENGQVRHETVGEVTETIAFAEMLEQRGYLHYIAWSAATPIHGSELFAIARRHGFIDEHFYPCHRWHVTRHLKDVSRHDFNRLLKRGLRLQARLAVKNGGIGWGNWRRILAKGLRMLVGNAAPRISDFTG